MTRLPYGQLMMKRKMRMNNSWNLDSALVDVKSVAIAGHVRPDGDCIGSCMALYHYITDNYPEVAVNVFLEEIPSKFYYIEKADKVIKHVVTGAYEADLFIAIDCGDKERLGFAGVLMERAKKTLNIDHHISNTNFAETNWVKPDASAACEILCEIMPEERIGYNTAVALFTGIIHDTGVFKHSNTTRATFNAAGMLVSKGIPSTEIINDSFFQKTYIQNQILGRALLESVLFYDKKCIFTVVSQKDMDFYGVSSADLDGIVNQLVITEGVELAIFMYEVGLCQYKVSLRSNKYIDVSKVASQFGGGGHVRAAGCMMHGKVHDVINSISNAITSQMGIDE